MKQLTPSELAALKRQRAGQPPVRLAYSRTDEAFTARYAYLRSWDRLTAQERVNALGAIAAELRALAEQVDEERLQIAQEELSA